MGFLLFEDWINEKVDKDIIVLFPGSFKPMHGAHIDLINRYINHSDVKEVKIFIGPGIRNGIDQKLALIIGKKLLSNFKKISIEKVQYPTPILTVYKYIEIAKPGTYTLASSKKGDDYKRIEKFISQHQIGGKYFDKRPKNVNIIDFPIDFTPVVYKGRNDNNEGNPISASILRQDVINNNYENFKTNYPDSDINTIKWIWKLLKPVIIE